MSTVSWKIPKYDYRKNGKREMQFDDGTRLLLSVQTSTIPNSGLGLFLTYLGNSNDKDDDDNDEEGNPKKWAPSQIVDLGVYSPHTESDIKTKHIMEVKFFLFEQYPAIYCFSGPNYKEEDYEYLKIEEKDKNSSIKKRRPQQLRALASNKQGKMCSKNVESAMKAPLLYGKKLYDIFYDCTSEKYGKLHQSAQTSLLPYANESTPEMMQLKSKIGDDDSYLKPPSLSARFHPDGRLHYVLLPNIKTFFKGVTTELFVYYGKDYQGVRDRTMEYSLRSTNQSITSLIPDNLGQPFTKCATCKKCWTPTDTATHLDDDDFPNTGYIAMRKAISTFTESQIIDILHYFLDHPPEPSDARRRLWWVVTQIRTYCQDLLYHQDGIVPSNIAELIEEALKLFPRKAHAEDDRILSEHQFLGEGVRMLVRNQTNNKMQWLNGYVEAISHDKSDTDDRSNTENMHYKIVFINGQHTFLSEDKLQNFLFDGRHGSM